MQPDQQAESTAGNLAGYDDGWLDGRCAVETVAATFRGDPEKLRALTFLAACWLEHKARCAATKR